MLSIAYLKPTSFAIYWEIQGLSFWGISLWAHSALFMHEGEDTSASGHKSSFYVCLMVGASSRTGTVIAAENSVLCIVLQHTFSSISAAEVTFLISCQDPQSLAFCTLSVTVSVLSALETQ